MNGYDLVRLQPKQVNKNGDTMTGTLVAQAGVEGDLTGNADTATTLKNSRTITIGNTGKTFNGSSNISWTIADIGAVNKAGDTMTGDLTATGLTSTGTGVFSGNVAIGGATTLTNGHDMTINPNTARVGGYEAYRVGNGRTRIAGYSSMGALSLEGFDGSSTLVMAYNVTSDSITPRDGVTGFTPSLGESSARWAEVWCTRGAFNGSDSKLKENISEIPRKQTREHNIEVTSQDFYDYVKNSSAKTFNYKNTTENFVGVIADEIPDNVFEKMGVVSKTDEEYAKELEQKSKYQFILSTYTPVMKINTLEDGTKEVTNEIDYDAIVEGTNLTYRELKYQSERVIESPVRLINGPAQIAMLQEVLSMALTKIESLELKVTELEAKVS